MLYTQKQREVFWDSIWEMVSYRAAKLAKLIRMYMYIYVCRFNRADIEIYYYCFMQTMDLRFLINNGSRVFNFEWKEIETLLVGLAKSIWMAKPLETADL